METFWQKSKKKREDQPQGILFVFFSEPGLPASWVLSNLCLTVSEAQVDFTDFCCCKVRRSKKIVLYFRAVMGNNDLRKLSSQTPPPRPVPFRQNFSSGPAKTTVFDDWIPWPNLVKISKAHLRSKEKPSNLYIENRSNFCYCKSYSLN